MDKQKEIEKMEFIISTTVHDCEQKDCIRNCQFARQKDCKYFRAAKDLQAEGYGDVRAAAEQLHQHPNTVRYRMRKMKAVLGIAREDDKALVNLLSLVYLPDLAIG